MGRLGRHSGYDGFDQYTVYYVGDKLSVGYVRGRAPTGKPATDPVRYTVANAEHDRYADQLAVADPAADRDNRRDALPNCGAYHAERLRRCRSNAVGLLHAWPAMYGRWWTGRLPDQHELGQSDEFRRDW